MHSFFFFFFIGVITISVILYTPKRFSGKKKKIQVLLFTRRQNILESLASPLISLRNRMNPGRKNSNSALCNFDLFGWQILHIKKLSWISYVMLAAVRSSHQWREYSFRNDSFPKNDKSFVIYDLKQDVRIVNYAKFTLY